MKNIDNTYDELYDELITTLEDIATDASLETAITLYADIARHCELVLSELAAELQRGG